MCCKAAAALKAPSRSVSPPVYSFVFFCRISRHRDHRSYKRQAIDKIPSVHLGPAPSQMEKRGIRTGKGEGNRQIVADNKLLKEIKARITRLYNWSKAEAEKAGGPAAQHD